MTKNNPWKVVDDGKLKTSEIVAEMRKLFKVFVYDEESADKNFPKPDKKTTRYFQKNIEADPENADKSANDLGEEGKINGITLRERLILELQYFKETGRHLDVENWTLCSGSRDSGGDVPSVHWSPGDGEVDVNWDVSGGRHSSMRSRQSCNPKSLSSFTPCQDKEHLRAVETVRKMKELIK